MTTVRLIKTEGQKFYLTKFCQDMSKAVLIVMVIALLVSSEMTPLLDYIVGTWFASIFFITGYILEKKEIK